MLGKCTSCLHVEEDHHSSAPIFQQTKKSTTETPKNMEYNKFFLKKQKLHL